eukprot:s88_g18.t1
MGNLCGAGCDEEYEESEFDEADELPVNNMGLSLPTSNLLTDPKSGIQTCCRGGEWKTHICANQNMVERVSTAADYRAMDGRRYTPTVDSLMEQKELPPWLQAAQQAGREMAQANFKAIQLAKARKARAVSGETQLQDEALQEHLEAGDEVRAKAQAWLASGQSEEAWLELSKALEKSKEKEEAFHELQKINLLIGSC